jgi:N-acetylglutamate synthase-like GNAT family acetyltransferase
VTSLLRWRPFEADDRDALERFVCTDPDKKIWDGRTKSHPRPWELSVQSAVRTHKPSLERDESMILGLDDVGVAAVCAWARYANPGQVLLQLVAVAMRHRDRGGLCAKEAVETVMTIISADARSAGAVTLLVEARIDRQNEPSKRLFSQAGFVYVDDCTENLERWAHYAEL